MIRDASIAFAMRAAGAGLWFGYTVALANYLGQQQFGSLLYILSFVLIAPPVAGLGVEFVTLKYGAIYGSADDMPNISGLLCDGYIIALLVGIILLSSLCALSSQYDDLPIIYSPRIAIITSLCVCLGILSAINRSALRSLHSISKATLGQNIIRPALSVLLSTVFFLDGSLELYRAALSLFLAYLLSFVLEIFWLRGYGLTISAFKIKRFLSHIRVGLGMWPGDAAGAVLQRAAGLVMGAIVSIEVAALYLAAERVAALANFVPDAVRMASGPKIASAGVGGKGALQKVVDDTSFLLFVPGLISIIFVGVSSFFILGLLGESFRAATPIVLVLLIGQVSWFALGPSNIVLNLAGGHIQRSQITVCAALVLIIFVALLTHRFGIMGAAYGVFLVTWLESGALCWAVYNRFGVRSGVLLHPKLILSVPRRHRSAMAVVKRAFSRFRF
ncbi:conserved membrane hypothetical protein [Oceanicaulis sp. 350]|nr:conserved membrane hypothetical protein [Oceanicaulis sp. 350]